jgi:RNA polymerase sigma factor (sigma-70 family)
MTSRTPLRDAIRRLGELGPVSEIIEHAAAEAAAATGLQRVLVSRTHDATLVAERLHPGGDADGTAGTLAELRRSPPQLAYPLVECELVRRRRARHVEVDPEQPARYAFASILGWREYVAAPVLVEGRAVGFLHGGGASLSQAHADALDDFGAGFALVFERAVLRRRLRDQRREIQRIASWAEVRSSELSDSVIDLSTDHASDRERPAQAAEAHAGIAQLTAREQHVLKLMAAGKTNGDIARALVVTEGTVKFHVKNILRKLQATNRAEATSRYLRLSLREAPPRGASLTHR